MTIEEMQKRKRELGFTNEMISELSNVPLATVQKVLGGITKSPRLDTIRALERVLGPAYEGWTYLGRKPADGNTFISEPPAGYGAYVYGTSTHKGYDDCYPLLPYKRQGEYTAADRDALPDDVRTELIDGVLYDMASPKPLHQLITGELYTQLYRCIEDAEREDCVILTAPSDVWLNRNDKTVVQPDIYIICEDMIPGEDEYVKGAPPLCVEVLSPSTVSRDRGIKLTKYLHAGVKAYWIVDPKKERVLVYQFGEDPEEALDPTVYSFHEKIPVGISDGHCTVDFAKIKARLDRFRKRDAGYNGEAQT